MTKVYSEACGERFCDLHTHSTYSDGTLTPRELIQAALDEKLSAVALCDHNTLMGIPEFLSAAEGQNIIAIPGVEISTEYKGIELHVLGLFVSGSAERELNDYLEVLRQRKHEANLELFTRLREAGYDVVYENIFSEKSGVINRVHFAKELIRLGHISSTDEGFRGILSAKNGIYIPAKRPDTLEVISLLKKLKVVSSLAHPLLNLSFDELKEFLPKAAETGLVAVETDYTKFDAKTTERLKALADSLGLLFSGGSDFHGENKKDNLLGRVHGGLGIPAEYFIKLSQVYKG